MDCPSCGHTNRDAARFCDDCGARLTAVSTPSVEGERRHLTVMFCDLVESTHLSAGLDPEEFANIIEAFQAGCRTALESWSGFVARTFGDGLLAYFGYPQAQEDAPSRALRAGLAVVQATRRLNNELVKAHPVLKLAPLAVRVGVHTGLVVVGDIGEEHLALGESVNLAARLQAVADPNQVVISDATRRLVPGMFFTRDLGTSSFKGVPELVRVHAVLQATGVRSRLEVDPSRLTPFVGRVEELATLDDCWRKARGGAGQVVLVSGEAGVGKSRLLHAFHKRLRTERYSWLECRGTQYTQDSAYYPLVELGEQGLGIDADDEPADKLRRLEDAVETAGLSPAEVVPFVAPLFLIPLPDRYPPREESPALLRKKTIETVVDWILAIAARQPLVMAFEDLHWFDPSTLELLGRLAERTPQANALLLLSHRPEFTAPWRMDHITALEVHRLRDREASALIQSAARDTPLSTEVAIAIVARADGVPLFLEEFTQAVVQPQNLTAETHRDRGASVLEIPATLRDSLMARLDRLGPGKEVAQVGAVLGREFSRRLIEAVSPMVEAALDKGLRRLTEASLLYQRGEETDAVYTFKHALIRDAAYDSLLKARRQTIHRDAAIALRQLGADEPVVPPEVLAHHLTNAAMPEQAIPLWKQAGARAATRHATVEASRHLEKGLALVRKLPENAARDREELAFLLALGGQLVSTRGYGAPEVLKTYERARDLCERTGDEKQLMRVLGGLFAVYTNRGQPDRARYFAEKQLSWAESTGDSKLTQRGHASLGMTFFTIGEHTKARHHMARAMAMYRPEWHRPYAAQDPGVAAATQAAMNLWYCGFPDAALNTAQEATQLAAKLEHPYSLALSLAHEAIVHQFRGEADDALRRADEALEVAENHNHPYPGGMAMAWKGCVIGETDPANGADLIASGSDRMKATGGIAWRLYHKATIAYLLARQGFYDRARDSIRPPASDERGAFVPEILRLYAEILSLAGQDSEARTYLDRALALSRLQEAKGLELRAAIGVARLCARRHQTAQARGLLAPIYGWFNEGFDTEDLKDAKALLEELG